MQASGMSEKAYFYPREGSTVFLSPNNVPTRERLARLRSLRALVQLLAGPRHPMTAALALAETDPTDEAALAAWKALETMPSLQRRRILASLGTLLKASPIRERKTG